MRTRLKDVAARLNLSPALVSGVLNNRPHIWASDETRARILETALALNYHPSAAAQALTTGKTDTVVFAYRRLEGAAYRLAYSGLVDALSAELQAAGYDLVVANFAKNETVSHHLLKLTNSRACDAFILWGREEDTEVQGRRLQDLRIPFVVKGRHEVSHPDWFQVDFDHEWMMSRALEHLADLGHRRIAYLGFPHDEGFVHALRRGFVDGHAARFGQEPSASLIAEFEDEVAPNAMRIEEWLALSAAERPTAFVIGAGNKAWQALEISLAHRGARLSDAPGAYSACGITSSPFSMMFGDAFIYRGIEIDNLARFVTPGLIHAIAQGEETSEASRISRFRPTLEPAPTLDILSHGVAFTASPADRRAS